MTVQPGSPIKWSLKRARVCVCVCVCVSTGTCLCVWYSCKSSAYSPLLACCFFLDQRYPTIWIQKVLNLCKNNTKYYYFQFLSDWPSSLDLLHIKQGALKATFLYKLVPSQNELYELFSFVVQEEINISISVYKWCLWCSNVWPTALFSYSQLHMNLSAVSAAS